MVGCENPRVVNETTRSKIERGTPTILEAISNLFDERKSPSRLPLGVEAVERPTIEAIRIKFRDEIDEETLTRIALREGYRVESGDFTPRIRDREVIVARIGSRSDVGGRHDLYIYPFPPEIGKLSMYRRAIALRRGIIDLKTGRVNLRRLHRFNLKIIRLVSLYIKERYLSL
jgi:hypothetical protein